MVGCAHAGVANTLDYVSRVTGQGEIRAILGGMDLLRASRPRIQATMKALKRFELKMIAPAHCTWPEAIFELRGSFPNQVIECVTGSRFLFTQQE